MAKKSSPVSNKRIQIDKNNASMVIVLAVAAFVTVFSFFACKALLNQRSYQGRVITQKKKALAQLKVNNQTVAKLAETYKVFISSPDNKIGGNSKGTNDKDGDNAKIVLDALPSKYDFPALAASLEKLLTTGNNNYKIEGITGVDEELKQSVTAAASDTAAVAAPVEMPFQIAVTGTFDTIQNLNDVMQRSIRPIKVLKLTYSGDDAHLKLAVDARTYYQPEKIVRITTKVVK